MVDSIAALRIKVIEVPDGSRLVADLRAEPRVAASSRPVRDAEADPVRPALRRPVVAAHDRLETVFGTSRRPAVAVVAVLDTGVDASTPTSPATSSPARRSSTAPPARPTPTATARPWPASSPPRRTTATGIAGIGYAGVKVMPVTVLGADGKGQDSDIIEGIV